MLAKRRMTHIFQELYIYIVHITHDSLEGKCIPALFGPAA